MPVEPKSPVESVCPITVVNRHHPGATGDYVGRGSALGNIFGLDAGLELDVILDRYRWWLAGELANPATAAAREISRFAQQARSTPVNVMCSCAPRRCHADDIRAAVYAKLGLPAPQVDRPLPKGADQLALFAASTPSPEHAAAANLFATLRNLAPDTPEMTVLVRYRKFLASLGVPAASSEGVITAEAQAPETLARFVETIVPTTSKAPTASPTPSSTPSSTGIATNAMPPRASRRR